MKQPTTPVSLTAQALAARGGSAFRSTSKENRGISATTNVIGARSAAPVVVCMSHLRWDFVFQRPQHLLTRFAQQQRVFYIEEPIIDDGHARMVISKREFGLYIVTPHVPPSTSDEALHATVRALIDRLFAEQGISQHILWFYTPMALPFASHLHPTMVVYDCMDELSAFAGAPLVMREREQQLMSWADLVFTGGHSLYAAKRAHHPRVHAFPSSIDQTHFAQARTLKETPADQGGIPGPRIGFYGVIDERFDRDLLDGVARLRPDWHFIVVGPVVKIDPATLPRHDNIHYLGRKEYSELPAYLAGWDVAIMPFARNESTRFISPTKTPEYLSAGRPVVSTSIADVVSPYGELKLVRIADDPAGFVAAIAAAFGDTGDPVWRGAVAENLRGNSWDRTWERMRVLMTKAAKSKGHPRTAIFPAA